MTGLLTLLVIIGYKTRSSTAEFRDVDL